MAVIQLQRDVEDCRSELEVARKQTSAVTRRPQRRSGFTSTPVPRYSGKSNWDVRSHCMFKWLGRCQGGPTAAIPSGRRCTQCCFTGSGVSKGGARIFYKVVIRTLQCSGRLAEYKRQFQREFRRPGDDPSIFATELETLAQRAFMDIDLKIQLQMVRDRFIDGQAERALHRHFDSLGPNTPMTDIVDCCRIWERHCEVEIQPRTSLQDGRRNTSETSSPTDPGRGVGRPDQ